MSKVLQPEATLTAYVTGFVASLVLTLTAYMLAVHHDLSRRLLIGVMVVLALTQFVVQLVYFLHLNKESKPRWKFYVFLFMSGVVLILVFGSLWIMSNLNYHMTQAQVTKYLQSQSDL